MANTSLDVIKSYSLYLNTREADYGDSNNCTFIFTTPLVLTNTNNRFRVSTPMVEMPYSFSQVNSNNNVVPFQYTDFAPTPRTNINLSITIPQGNYNILQLINIFIDLVVAAINANAAITGGANPNVVTKNNFSIIYNQNTGDTSWKIIYTSNFTYGWYLQFNFQIAYVIGSMFGWARNDTPIITNTAYVTTPNKVMVNPITSVYIRSESLKFESNYEALVRNITAAGYNGVNPINNFQNSDILQKIPITTLPNSIIYYRSDTKSIITNKELGELNLYVSDNLSPTFNLDLQGLNYGIFVLIEEVQLPQTNAYQDKIEVQPLSLNKGLMEERQKLVDLLVIEKEKLEKDIERQKKVQALQ